MALVVPTGMACACAPEKFVSTEFEVVYIYRAEVERVFDWRLNAKF